MTVYADLDTSIIDELPPGRTPITTVVISEERRDEIVARVKNACINEKRQAYWVCTLIDESEVLEAQAAEAIWEDLTKALPMLKNWSCTWANETARKNKILWLPLKMQNSICLWPQP